MEKEAKFVQMRVRGIMRELLTLYRGMKEVVDYADDVGVKFDGTVPEIPADQTMVQAMTILTQLVTAIEQRRKVIAKTAQLGAEL